MNAQHTREGGVTLNLSLALLFISIRSLFLSKYFNIFCWTKSENLSAPWCASDFELDLLLLVYTVYYTLSYCIVLFAMWGMQRYVVLRTDTKAAKIVCVPWVCVIKKLITGMTKCVECIRARFAPVRCYTRYYGSCRDVEPTNNYNQEFLFFITTYWTGDSVPNTDLRIAGTGIRYNVNYCVFTLKIKTKKQQYSKHKIMKKATIKKNPCLQLSHLQHRRHSRHPQCLFFQPTFISTH